MAALCFVLRLGLGRSLLFSVLFAARSDLFSLSLTGVLYSSCGCLLCGGPIFYVCASARTVTLLFLTSGLLFFAA